MTESNDSTTKVESPASDSPFNREFFLVQGPTYRCMAYKDRNGNWHGAFNEMELPGPVQILA